MPRRPDPARSRWVEAGKPPTGPFARFLTAEDRSWIARMLSFANPRLNPANQEGSDAVK